MATADRIGRRLGVSCLAVALLCGATRADRAVPVPSTGRPPHTPAQVPETEHAYLDENAAAMKRMMAGMTVRPTGDVDRDFVDMMLTNALGPMRAVELFENLVPASGAKFADCSRCYCSREGIEVTMQTRRLSARLGAGIMQQPLRCS